jgi:hypothetical protein
MRIDAQVLAAVAQDLLARYGAADHQGKGACGFEAIGILRVFVRGYAQGGDTDRRHYEALAHLPEDDEDPF